MDRYVTGAVIRKLRENKRMTQEELAEARFKINRVRKLYAYCNRHGLFQMKI